jgi:GT2 family glycosyltransferase
MTRCSVVIPAYNRPALTKQCLDAIFASPPERAELEVVVVDDGSSEPLARTLSAHAERIEIVRHEQNTGFARACNDGAAEASGEWLVFLNNDTVPQPGWLDELIDYASPRESIGVVGSKLLFPDGTVQHAGVVISRELIPHHLYTRFPADHPAVNKSREFQIVTAACALLRRETFERIGRFDHAFVNGYEDIDLCLRLRREGYQVHYCHTSVLEHLEAVTRERKRDARNHALFLERWSDFVKPDDLAYFSEDGLIEITYQEEFPILLSVSPLLAILDGERASGVDRILATRSKQVFDALKDNTSLKVELLEARAQAAKAAEDTPAPATEPLQHP